MKKLIISLFIFISAFPAAPAPEAKESVEEPSYVYPSAHRAPHELKGGAEGAAAKFPAAPAPSAPSKVSNTRSLNLVLVVGSSNKLPPAGDPLINEFALAIKQKVAAIITNENTLFNFLTFRQQESTPENRELYVQRKEEKRKNKILQELYAQFNKECDSLKKKLDQDILEIDQLLASQQFTNITIKMNKPSELQSLVNVLDTIAALNIGVDVIPIKDEIGIINDIYTAYEQYPITNTQFTLERLGKSLDFLRTMLERFEREQRALQEALLTTLLKKTDIEIELKSQKSAKAYLKIPFIVSDWHIYKHAQAALYLLVPKNYAQDIEKEYEQFLQKLEAEAKLKSESERLTKIEIEKLEAELKTASADRQKEIKAEIERLRKETSRSTRTEAKPGIALRDCADPAALQYSAKEKALGFVVDHSEVLTALSDVTTEENLLAYIKKGRNEPALGFDVLFPPTTYYDFPLNKLKQMFVVGKAPELGSQNICMMGHGMYVREREILVAPDDPREWLDAVNSIKDTARDIYSGLLSPQALLNKEEFDSYNSTINKLLNAYDEQTNQGMFNFIDEFRDKSRELMEIATRLTINPTLFDNRQLFAQYLYTLATKVEKAINEADAQRKKYMTTPSKHGTIAGLVDNEFKDWIKFLYRCIKTSFLCVTTCYGGGANLEMVRTHMQFLENEENRTFKDLSGSFIIATVTLTDIPSLAPSRVDKEHYLNFAAFFADLKKYFSQDSTFAKDPIATILSHVTTRKRDFAAKDIYGITGIGSVYFPGIGIARAQSIDSEIMILTQTKLKSYELIIPGKKTKVEPIKTQGKSALLIYPTNIKAPVLLGVDSQNQPTALVPMVANKVTFDEIDASTISLLDLLKKSIMNIRSITPRTFEIKLLRCKNYPHSGLSEDANVVLTLHDLSATSAVAPTPSGETINWTVRFSMIGPDDRRINFTDTMQEASEGVINDPQWH